MQSLNFKASQFNYDQFDPNIMTFMDNKYVDRVISTSL